MLLYEPEPLSLNEFQLSINSALCMLAHSTTNANALGGKYPSIIPKLLIEICATNSPYSA
jgi:hypothetical protein